jgi:CII-binding regulator of phage lambda lysogenization HflD
MPPNNKDHLMEIITRFTDIMHQKSATDAILNTSLNNIEKHIRELNIAIAKFDQSFEDIESIIREIKENMIILERNIRQKQEIDANLEIAKIQQTTDIVKVTQETRSKIIATIGSIIIAVVSSLGTFLYMNTGNNSIKEKYKKETMIDNIKSEDDKSQKIEE